MFGKLQRSEKSRREIIVIKITTGRHGNRIASRLLGRLLYKSNAGRNSVNDLPNRGAAALPGAKDRSVITDIVQVPPGTCIVGPSLSSHTPS
jgi:hypothetical protein